MLSDGVYTVFHFEVLAFDSHVVALVETFEDLLGLHWKFGNVFVDFGHFTREHKFDVFKF